jgi:hypothetical protein
MRDSMLNTQEDHENMMKYWDYLRRPSEQVAIESIVPTPAVITWKPDETPVRIISYQFNTFEAIQAILFLEIMQNHPDGEATKQFFPEGFTQNIGKFFVKQNMLDATSPEFENDVALIAEQCAVTVRDPRKAEYVHKIAELTINIEAVCNKNNQAWLRFGPPNKGLQSKIYFKKCDLPRDINIPG